MKRIDLADLTVPVVYLVGVLMIFWMSVSPKRPGEWGWVHSPLHELFATVIGISTILLAGRTVSRLPGQSRASEALLSLSNA